MIKILKFGAVFLILRSSMQPSN
uniref:Uncharacterized protein n=1 Tax=Arundo donax TaxID=35708 RepID=A0A0A8ZY19_ARUDO